MTYMNSRDIYIFRIKKGGVRAFQALVTEEKASERLRDIRRAERLAFRGGRKKRRDTFECRTVWGEVVEL